VQAPHVVKNLGAFKPDKKASAAKTIADALAQTPEDRQAVIALAQATREAFESQPEMKRWKNNVAGALAFFLIGNATVANGSPEPSDEVTEALFTAMNETIDDSPDFAKVSNKEKQQLYEMLITFTGLSLALASQAEETKDEAMAAQARELATQLLKLVLKVDAAQVRFERPMPNP
jgi:outer membrane murein-binding lipoprotein Lpp